MNGFVLDTNHVSAALPPVSALRNRLQQVHRSGIRLGTCIPVFCELEAGIQESKHEDAIRRALKHVRQIVIIWPLEIEDARRYGELYNDLRRRGRALSQVDIMLAAFATRTKMTLLTTDRDFEALPDLPTENWLAS